MSLARTVFNVLPPSMRTIRRLASASLDGTISVQHLRVMAYVKEGMGQAQMACSLGVSAAAVSKMIGGLEEKGFLKRTKGAEDRRATDLKLTSRGVRIMSLVRGQVEKRLQGALLKMDKDERMALEQGLLALDRLMKLVNEGEE